MRSDAIQSTITIQTIQIKQMNNTHTYSDTTIDFAYICQRSIYQIVQMCVSLHVCSLSFALMRKKNIRGRLLKQFEQVNTNIIISFLILCGNC